MTILPSFALGILALSEPCASEGQCEFCDAYRRDLQAGEAVVKYLKKRLKKNQ